MITLATDEAMLLHMHQALVSACIFEDDDDDEGREQDAGKQVANDNEKGAQNGTYYDVRIKTHYFRNQRQIVFVFTNVSAEKDLQRELVMKQYSQIMFTSINHELRTPINAIINSLTCMRPYIVQMAQ